MSRGCLRGGGAPPRSAGAPAAGGRRGGEEDGGRATRRRPRRPATHTRGATPTPVFGGTVRRLKSGTRSASARPLAATSAAARRLAATGAPLIPPPRSPTARRAGGARPSRSGPRPRSAGPSRARPARPATRQPARLQSPISGSAAWTSGRGKRSTRAASTSTPSIQTRTEGHGLPPRSWHQPPTTNPPATVRPSAGVSIQPGMSSCGPVSPDQSDEMRERVGTTRRPPSRATTTVSSGTSFGRRSRNQSPHPRDRRSTGTRGARSQRTQFVSGPGLPPSAMPYEPPHGIRAAAWAIPSA